MWVLIYFSNSDSFKQLTDGRYKASLANVVQWYNNNIQLGFVGVEKKVLNRLFDKAN